MKTVIAFLLILGLITLVICIIAFHWLVAGCILVVILAIVLILACWELAKDITEK
jgi:hypothetical protein